MKRRVVITGAGIIAPLGTTADSFWNNCLKGIASVAPIPEQWHEYASYSCRLWAPLPQFDHTAYGINRIECMQMDYATLLGCSACRQALEASLIGIYPKDDKKNTYTLHGIDPRRCGVFIGTGIGGVVSLIAAQAFHSMYTAMEKLNGTITLPESNMHGCLEEVRKLLRMPPRFNPFSIAMVMPNATAAAIGIKYSVTGPNTTYTNACAAGTVAIGHAFQAITSSVCDIAITGGTEYIGDTFGGIFKAFDIAKTLVRDCSDPARANRPFDKKRSGFLMAEGGSAILILESYDHAVARNAPMLAEIKGFAESFDGYSILAPDPEAKGIESMIRSALQDADLAAPDIDYVNTHGTGTMMNDDIEAGCIERLFPNGPLVNATKSLIGHTIGASGAIETAVTAFSIRHQKTHICKNLDEPVRDLNFVRAQTAQSINAALTHSFAFGGHNAGLVLTRV